MCFWNVEQRFLKLYVGVDIVDKAEIEEVVLVACILHNLTIMENDVSPEVHVPPP